MIRYFACLAVLFTAGFVTAAEPRVASRWAVLVGVDDYVYLEKLRFCGADQAALRDRLVASSFPSDQVFLLHDKATEPKLKPTKGNIERQLNVVLQVADPEDLVVIAFSGHGVHLDGKSYLCPGDCTGEDPATLISVDGIYDRLKQCAAGFKLVVVDACRNDPRPGGTRSIRKTDGARALALTFQEMKLPEGVVLLNSCAPGEVSWEDEKFGHGVFMNFVLDGLTGSADANGDGAVSLMELQSHAGSRTKVYVANSFSSVQRPFFKGDLTTEALEYALLPVKAAVARVPTTVAPAASLPTSTSSPPVATTSPPTSTMPTNSGTDNTITNSIGMKLTLLPAGEFMMGATAAEAGTAHMEQPPHRVRITRPFLLSIHEVTQGQWQAVMNTTPWKGQRSVKEGADYAATYVSWLDAREFCRILSEKEGKQYGLPTEAQWEYACRAGTTTKHSIGEGESLGDYAWYGAGPSLFSLAGPGAKKSSGEENPQPVGLKRPNPWGLYDMHGNVKEWCNDGYDGGYYKQSPVDDPPGLGWGKIHPVRGGGWNGSFDTTRSAYRLGEEEEERDAYMGFRVTRHP